MPHTRYMYILLLCYICCTSSVTNRQSSRGTYHSLVTYNLYFCYISVASPSLQPVTRHPLLNQPLHASLTRYNHPLHLTTRYISNETKRYTRRPLHLNHPPHHPDHIHCRQSIGHHLIHLQSDKSIHFTSYISTNRYTSPSHPLSVKSHQNLGLSVRYTWPPVTCPTLKNRYILPVTTHPLHLRRYKPLYCPVTTHPL